MKKSLLAVMVLCVAVFAVWRWRASDSPSPAAADNAELVANRLWIDHLPRNDRDTVQVFAAITEEPVGIFQQTSAWRGSFEVFRHELHGDQLRVVYPQTGKKENIRARARACDRNGMDYCLDLSGSSHGVKHYYSLEGWEIGSLRDAKAKLAHLTGR